MSDISIDLTKSFANRVAASAGTEDPMRLLRLLRHSGIFSPVVETSSGQPHAAHNKPPQQAVNGHDRVGIWERKTGSDVFVRRLDLADAWQWWANVGRIGPKQAKYRLVLIGESVARGYLYDPQFNPAKALDGIFRQHLGANEIEVVDLAKTGMTCEQLKEVAESALLLNPDYIVIFAGNNWVLDNMKEADTESVAAMATEGVPGLKRLAEQKLAELARNVVGKIAKRLSASQVRLVWVIPEFNLGDWRDVVTNAPYLTNGKNREWIECYRKATNALMHFDHGTASALAKEMLAMDGATGPAAFYILAECARNNGDMQAARSCLESARDAVMDRRFMTPRPHSVVQQALRDEISRHGMCVVDLPRIFAEYHSGSLPDRRLFLDYCHLTAEGIEVAMNAVASSVVRSLNRHRLPVVQGSHAEGPTRQAQSEAMFLAAVYNAHLHQPREVVEYFCRESLRLWPDIAGVMACFADFQMRQSPMLMCKSGEQLAAMQVPSIHKYLLRFNLHLHQLDRTLLESITTVLQEVGLDSSKQLDRLRIEERTVTLHPVDLLDHYYCSSAQHEFGQPDAGQENMDKFRRDYYRAYSPESKFLFIAKGNHPVLLELVCRLPEMGCPEGYLGIELNNEYVGDLPLSRKWQHCQILARPEIVQKGINEIVIRWPDSEIQGKKGADAALEEMLAHLVPEFYPVFGEIHSLTAVDPRKTSETEQAIVASSLSHSIFSR